MSVRWNRPKSSEMARPRSTTGNEERCGEKRRGLAEPTTEPIPSAGPNTKTKTMKTTTTSVLLALALLPLAADAHGYMTKPPSRSDLAHETYVPENPEFCPHCVASVGQVSDCAGCGSRGYPQCGNQPVRQAGLEVLFTILTASTQRESAWRPRTKRLRLTHRNI